MEETLTPRDRTIAIAALLLGGVAIGAAPIFVRLAENEGVGPSAIAFWRLVFAVGPLALWAALEPKRASAAPSTERQAMDKPGRILLLAGAAGFFFAADLVTWHAGIVRTTAANATLLANLTPIVVALFAWFIFKERPTPLFLAALAATLLGSALLSGGNLAGADASDAPLRALGDLLSALTAFWYAFYMLAVKAVRAAWPTPRVMAVTSAVAVPFTLAPALLFGETFLPESAYGWLWLAGSGLICQIVGQTGIAYGLGRVSAALSSLVILIQPVVAAAIAWVLFGEALGPLELAGGALVIAGIIAAQRQSTPATAGRLAQSERNG